MIKYTDDEELKKSVLEALKMNDGYCPCRTAHTEDTKCMCKEFKEQEKGVCHCGLFEKI